MGAKPGRKREQELFSCSKDIPNARDTAHVCEMRDMCTVHRDGAQSHPARW